MGMLDGKTTVITGALGGQGRAACERFCAEGATVIGIDRTGDDAALFGKELTSRAGLFEFHQADVASPKEVEAVAAAVAARHDTVDVLYNNAGIMQQKSLLDTTDEDWDHVLGVNLTSTFLMMRAFVALMGGASGSIINVSSTGALRAWDRLGPYGAAKAGVTHLTKVAAVEFAPRIRVNVICPGMIDTPMARGFATKLPNPDSAWQAMTEQTVLGRFGESAEVASLAAWLAGDESSFVTGHEIVIDGGATLR